MEIITWFSSEIQYLYTHKDLLIWTVRPLECMKSLVLTARHS